MKHHTKFPLYELAVQSRIWIDTFQDLGHPCVSVDSPSVRVTPQQFIQMLCNTWMYTCVFGVFESILCISGLCCHVLCPVYSCCLSCIIADACMYHRKLYDIFVLYYSRVFTQYNRVPLYIATSCSCICVFYSVLWYRMGLFSVIEESNV